MDVLDVALTHAKSRSNFWEKHGNQMDMKLFRHILNQNINDWTIGETHPFILCKCNMSMKYFCGISKSKNTPYSNWTCANPKEKCGSIVWSSSASAILTSLNHMCHMVPKSRVYFSPVEVRLSSHIGFPLINHTPPMASANSDDGISEWAKYDPIELRGQDETDDGETISIQKLKKWIDCEEPLPVPSLFEGFRASQFELHLMTKFVKFMRDHQLVCDMVLPSFNVLRSEKEILQYQDAMQKLSDFAIQNVSAYFIEAASDHCVTFEGTDYIMHTSLNGKKRIKVLNTWRIANESYFMVPLHGMGKTDIEWLYGMHDIILLEIFEQVIIVDSTRFRNVMLCEANKIKHTKGEEAILRVSDFVPSSTAAPSNAPENVSISDIQRECDKHNGTITESCDCNDSDRHDAIMPSCGTDCARIEGDNGIDERYMDYAGLSGCAKYPLEINYDKSNESSAFNFGHYCSDGSTHDNENQSIVILSLSNKRAKDEYLAIPPKVLYSLICDHALHHSMAK